MRYIKMKKLSKLVRYLLLVFLLVAMILPLIPTNSVLAEAEWLGTWTKRTKIDIDYTDGIGAAVIWLPVAIIIESGLAGIGNKDVSAIFDELTADANRFKIAVTKSDGTTQLYVEIEQWDDAGENAVLWVSKDDWLINDNTSIFIYYDVAHADNTSHVFENYAPEVYDADYERVLHLSDETIAYGAKNSHGVWHNRPKSAYFNGITYFAYLNGVEEEVNITTYNHSSNAWTISTVVSTTFDEPHCSPTLAIDSEGYIYVGFGEYDLGLDIHLYKSTNPEDITAWDADLEPYSGGAATYCIILIDSNDNIVVTWRDSSKMYKVYSTNNGTDWSAAQTIVDLGAGQDRVYPALTIDDNDRVHLAYTPWQTYWSAYRNIYYAYTDNVCNASTVWKEADGDTISLPMRYETGHLVAENVILQTIQVNTDNKVYILSNLWGGLYVSEYNGGWNGYSVGNVGAPYHIFDSDMLIDGQYTINVVSSFGAGKDIREYQSTTATPSFSKIRQYNVAEVSLFLDYVEDASSEVNLIYRAGSGSFMNYGYYVYSGSDTNYLPEPIKSTEAIGLIDSTTSGAAGLKFNVDQPEEVDGVVGKGQDFGGTGENISLFQITTFTTSDPWTCEFWIDASSATHMIIGKDADYNYIAVDIPGDLIYFMDSGGQTDSQAADMTADANHYVCLVASGTGAPTVYLDGVSKGQLSAENLGSDWTINNLGSAYAAGASEDYDLRGVLDEVRVSTVTRSAAWIKASFNSGNDTLLTYEVQEEEEEREPTVTTQDATDLIATLANLHGTVVFNGSLTIDEQGFETIGIPIIETELTRKAHGGIYVDGYIYIIQYWNPGSVIKFSATNYAVSSTLVPTHSGIEAGPLWDIIYAAGYIWVCDYNGWVYKIDLVSFTTVAAYQCFSTVASAICSDDTYIYVAYVSVIGRITISTGAITYGSDTELGVIHSIVEDGDFIYVNNITDKLLVKIRKSDLSIYSYVDIEYSCADDIAQDDIYIYLGSEEDGRIIRVSKSLMIATSQPSADMGKSYGVFNINDEVLYLDYENDYIWRFDSTLSIIGKIILLEVTGLGINELIDGETYLHLTTWTTEGLSKYEKNNILDCFDWTESGSFGEGSFNHLISGLTEESNYCYRAKAHNSLGWGYGDEVDFTTIGEIGGPTVTTQDATLVETTTAKGHGTITDLNDAGNCDYIGVDYDIDSGGPYDYSTTSFGDYGIGEFEETISSLNPDTLYYYRAKAHNNGGWGYGNELTFVTDTLGIPIVTAKTVTEITSSGTRLQGSLDSLGDYSLVYVFFEYGLTGTYDAIGSPTITQTKTTVGSINQLISGLAAETLYYFRVVVTIGENTWYSAPSSFYTLPLGLPSVSTGIVVDRTTTSAILQGILSSMEDYSPIYVYFEYGLTTDYGTSTVEQTKTAIGEFSQAISGLSSGILYHYRAVARYGTDSYVYGNDNTFYSRTTDEIEGILLIPDYIWLGNVRIFESYQATGDQLIVFQYALSYGTEPTQDASDFFRFEIYDEGNITASSPVMTWGEMPGSIYLSPSNALIWRQAFTLKLAGIPGQWGAIIPEETYSVSPVNWVYDRTSLDLLDRWVFTVAEVINSDWIVKATSGDRLSDEACTIFNRAISGLSNVRTEICYSGIVYPDYEDPDFSDEGQEALTREKNLGSYINGLLDDMGNLVGMNGDSMGTMIMAFICLILMVAIGAITRNAGWAMISAVPVISFGNYIGLIGLAFTLIITSIIVLYFYYTIWIRGV